MPRLKPRNYLLLFGLGLLLAGCESKQNVANLPANPIGEQIRRARLAQQISQQQLADSLRMSALSLSLIEDGFASPLPYKIKQMEQMLNTRFDWDSSAVVF